MLCLQNWLSQTHNLDQRRCDMRRKILLCDWQWSGRVSVDQCRLCDSRLLSSPQLLQQLWDVNAQLQLIYVFCLQKTKTHCRFFRVDIFHRNAIKCTTFLNICHTFLNRLLLINSVNWLWILHWTKRKFHCNYIPYFQEVKVNSFSILA